MKKAICYLKSFGNMLISSLFLCLTLGGSAAALIGIFLLYSDLSHKIIGIPIGHCAWLDILIFAIGAVPFLAIVLTIQQIYEGKCCEEPKSDNTLTIPKGISFVEIYGHGGGGGGGSGVAGSGSKLWVDKQGKLRVTGSKKKSKKRRKK